jgi:uncharacterized protein (TIGR02001 family)
LVLSKDLDQHDSNVNKDFNLTLGARIQSDYNSRGLTQSDHRPSLQSYAEFQSLNNLFYAGISFFQVDLPTRPTIEVDYAVGIRPKFGPFTFDLSVIAYAYANERRLIDGNGTIYTPANTDFNELAAKVTYAHDERLSFGTGVFHTRNWSGSGASASYGFLFGKYLLPIPGWSLSGEVGHYWVGTTSPGLGSIKLRDYAYWNAGASYTWKNFTIDLRYHDTTLDAVACYINTADPLGALRGAVTGLGTSNWCGARVIGSLTFEFATSAPGIFAPPK